MCKTISTLRRHFLLGRIRLNWNTKRICKFMHKKILSAVWFVLPESYLLIGKFLPKMDFKAKIDLEKKVNKGNLEIWSINLIWNKYSLLWHCLSQQCKLKVLKLTIIFQHLLIFCIRRPHGIIIKKLNVFFFRSISFIILVILLMM